MLHLGSRARKLSTALRDVTATQVRGAAVFGDDSSRIHFIVPAQITWSPQLFLHTSFEGTGAEEELRTLTAGLVVIPGLNHQVREGRDGLFRRCFRPGPVQTGDRAAFDLMVRLDELEAPATEVRRLPEGADTARAAQTRGVQLFPGTHGVGQRYLDAARVDLAAALDLKEPDVTECPGTMMHRARLMVENYTPDSGSEIRLRGDPQPAHP